MLGFRIDQARSNFFDREKVRSRVSRGTRRALSMFGAKVRTRAISSILRHSVRRGFGAKTKVSNRQGVSEPGTPPFAHLGLIPKFLFFAFDPEAESVVIGPALLSGVRAQKGALRVLEEGGTEDITRRGIQRRANYQARPFMAPAFQAELPGAAPAFEGQVRE